MGYQYLEEQGFRKGTYKGIPIYVRNWENPDEGLEVYGRNKFWDILLDIAIFMCVDIRGDEYFEVSIPMTAEEVKEYKKNNSD